MGKEETKNIQNSGGDESGKLPKQPKSTVHGHACFVCGQTLLDLTSLRKHINRVHNRNYKCSYEECERSFKEKSGLDAHEKVHQMRECHICRRKFKRKQNADIHLMGVHSLKIDDLKKLGRWNPTGDGLSFPYRDYLIPKVPLHPSILTFESLNEEDDDESNVGEITIKEEPLFPDDDAT